MFSDKVQGAIKIIVESGACHPNQYGCRYLRHKHRYSGARQGNFLSGSTLIPLSLHFKWMVHTRIHKVILERWRLTWFKAYTNKKESKVDLRKQKSGKMTETILEDGSSTNIRILCQSLEN